MSSVTRFAGLDDHQESVQVWSWMRAAAVANRWLRRLDHHMQPDQLLAA